MESANLHHQQHHQLQLQDQLVIGSSPLPNTPSFFGVGTTLSWTPNTILNPSHFSSNIGNGGIVNSRDISRQRNDYFAPSLNNSSTIQDMGYQWATSNNIGNGGLSYPYQKFSETMINHSSSPSSSSSTQDFHLQQQQQQPTISYMKNEEREFSEMMNEKLLLRNFSSGCQIKGLQFQAGTSSSRGSFSQILPTINISNLNQSSNSSISGSLDRNMQPLDLFTTSHRFSGCLSPAASNHNLGFYKDNLYYGLDDHVQQSPHRLPNSPSNKISTFSSGVSEPKRPSSFLEAKVAQSAQKKSRSDSRAPCPPIKVRKEKLGDRIAALQQLVAPFGKTDTASVLMEAIGYIKFLQSQVETLSVPYMKSSRARTSTRTIRGGSAEDGNEESKRDLRSRGLCLVPLTCLSYVTEGGGGVWQPPNFG